MANRELGEMDVKIGGREFTLLPSFGAIAELEDRLDMSVFKVAHHLSSNDVRAKYVVAALWSGVKAHSRPDLTYEQFGELCVEGGASELAKVARVAMMFVSSLFVGKEQKKSLAEPLPPPQ